MRAITPTGYHLDYSVRDPAILIEPGEIVKTWLADAHGYDADMKMVAGNPNPLTGPFVLPEVKPGDTLSVTIHELSPNRPNGFACKDIHPYVQHPPRPIHDRRKEYVDWTIDLKGMTVSPPKDHFHAKRIELPIRPTLGCIGVAVPGMGGIPSRDCGAFGGNLDLPRITTGSTIHLPVLVEGGYLYLGDCHAIQGAGEITGNGVEVSAEVIFSVEEKRYGLQYPVGEDEGYGLQYPVGEDEGYIYTIGTGKPLEHAARVATEQMVKLLEGSYGMNRDQVGILLGQLITYEIGNLVSNEFSIACCFPKQYL